MSKIYIENCFCLTEKRVDKSLERYRRASDNTDIERKDIRYSYEGDIMEKLTLIVTVEGYSPQSIVVDPFMTPFGQRNYYNCPNCGKRHTKLYLKPGGHLFACASCYNLKYERFNPRSAQGRFLNHVQKVLELVKRQEEMTSRIWYRDVYTKKYEKFLADCLEAGLTDVVAEARELEANIKANELKNSTKAEI
jgi:hypothetical protein